MKAEVDRWSKERRRSGAHAGTAAAEFARRRIDAFVRRRWQPLVIVAIGSVLLAAGTWLLLPGSVGARGFAAGVFLAAMVGAMYHWVVLASGAAGIAALGSEMPGHPSL